MNKENYALLGLDESATDEEIKERYTALKKKYNEDRWLEGEAGNEAAKMLGKLDAAYTEIIAERREKFRADGSSALEEVATAIKNGDLTGAQAKLDECNERNAEWHYLQSVLFFRKNWMNESKKQLEIALQLEPENAKYKDAYERLKSRVDYQSQSARENRDPYVNPDMQQDQMGGNGCMECVSVCYTCLCVNCLYQLCCGCR